MPPRWLVDAEAELDWDDFRGGHDAALYVRWPRLMPVVAVVLAVYGFGVEWQSTPGTWIFPGLVLLWAATMPWRSRLACRRNFETLPPGELRVRYRVTLDAISCRTGADSRWTLSYSSIRRVLERGDQLVLALDDGNVLTIPLRCFRPEDRPTILKAVRRRVEESRPR